MNSLAVTIMAMLSFVFCAFPRVAAAQEQPGGQERFEVRKEIYLYTSYNRRDPFRSLIKPPEEEKGKKGATPLESYDLSQIKLIAVASDSRRAYALFVLPDGKSYTVTKGVPVGIHDGSVHQITADTVVIREYVRDYKGRIQAQDTVLRLRKKEGFE